MKKVWIAQLKCPGNHCVAAIAAEIVEDQTDLLEAKLWQGFRQLVDDKTLNHECGICKATMLHVEVKRTAFATIEEAMPTLAEAQRQQQATAEYLRQSKN